MDDVSIGPCDAADLPRMTDLLAGALGFGPRDAIPAWLAHVTAEAGGVCLAARAGADLVGASYAFPAVAGGEPCLYSCGLAVAPGWRGRGVGVALKLAQREIALGRGLEVIRWTADPVSAAALGLYLQRLGARIVGYRAGMFAGLRAGAGPELDDVEIRWDLTGAPAAAGAVARVEIPASPALDPARWRPRVRAEMAPLLAAGLEGTAVERHPVSGRVWVGFVAGAP